MQSHDQNQAAGNLKISREVIATIARYAALEIEGVDSLASFATNLKGWLLKKQSAKPIGIDLSDDVAVIELHVNIKAGVNIPETAEKIGVKDKEIVSVKIDNPGRALVFGDVVIRVSPSFRPAMHIDTDEANAAGCSGEVWGEVVK